MPLDMAPEWLRTVIGAAVFLYLVWWTGVRLLGESRDPVASTVIDTVTGQTTINISGTHLFIVGSIFIAWISWPMAMERPALPAALVSIVVIAWIIERREASQ